MRFRSMLVVTMVGAAVGLVATAADAAAAGWTRHTITTGFRGADGVDLADVDGDNDLDVATGWEQGGQVTVSLNPGSGTGEWTEVVLATRLHGVEDAIFADVDADGRLDVVTACECRRVVVYFAPERERVADPAAWTAVDLPGPVQRWLKVAVVDVDLDGRPDVIGGGKVSPATAGWFRAPTDPRNGAGWAFTPMSEVAWTMSLLPRDVDADGDADVVLSDRLPIILPGGGRRYDLRGSRWLENRERGATWVNHPIGFSFGEHKFLHVTDFDGDGVDDVLDGVSAPGDNRTFFRRNTGDWLSWEVTPIPQPAGVGNYLDVKTGDLDLDGDTDLVFSYSHADGDLSGVVALSATAGGWERVEISGPDGTKFDNVELRDLDGDGDLDAVTSEQVDQLGIVWYENPAH